MSQYDAVWQGSLNDVLALYALPPDYWTGSTGGTNVALDGGLNVNGFVAGVAATLTEEAPVTTPEPSSVALFFMGAMGLMGVTMFRKRAWPVSRSTGVVALL